MWENMDKLLYHTNKEMVHETNMLYRQDLKQIKLNSAFNCNFFTFPCPILSVIPACISIPIFSYMERRKRCNDQESVKEPCDRNYRKWKSLSLLNFSAISDKCQQNLQSNKKVRGIYEMGIIFYLFHAEYMRKIV
jgi:hypothetical protein